MSWEFWFGIVTGAAAMHIIRDVRDALEKTPETTQEKLNRCTLEAIRRNAGIELDAIPDEKLVRGIATGVLSVTSRTEPDRE